LHEFMRGESYKSAKEKLIIVYIVFILFGKVLMEDSTFNIFALILDAVLLFDTLLNIIAWRFCGVGSYTDGNIFIYLHFFGTILIAVNWIT
jgi:hypothetical protein